MSLLRTLPYAQFKSDPFFYVKHDAVFFVGALALVCALHFGGYAAPPREFALWHVALLPVAMYLMVVAHAWIHCASHGAWGHKALNRIVGEILGIIVLTKFASWEIVHRRHHRYSDDPVRDPHPAERSYWKYALHTIIGTERQLQQESFDVHGDTLARRRYERIRSIFSFTSGLTVALAWLAVLGAPLFFVVYLPAFVFGALFVMHFNWVGHNAHTTDGPIEPVNLDHGWFWFGNRVLPGIYFHANHHRLAMVFNPMKIPARRPSAVEEPIPVAAE